MPIVSVVIPTRNRARLIKRAVLSALKQTMSDLEVVVVDDGSTDDTIGRLRRIADPRLRWIEQEGSGASAARNAGILASTGTYIAFLDSDDAFLPTKLAAFLARLAGDPGIVLAHSAWIERGGSGERVHRPIARGDARHDMLRFAPIATPTVVARRQAILDVGLFDTSMTILEDYNLWCRLSAIGRFELIDEPLSIVFLHRGNIHRDSRLIEKNKLRIVEKYFATCSTSGLKPKAFYLANAFRMAADWHGTTGRMAERKLALVKAWLFGDEHSAEDNFDALARALLDGDDLPHLYASPFSGKFLEVAEVARHAVRQHMRNFNALQEQLLTLAAAKRAVEAENQALRRRLVRLGVPLDSAEVAEADAAAAGTSDLPCRNRPDGQSAPQ